MLGRSQNGCLTGKVCCHSTGGDTATALADRTFLYDIYSQKIPQGDNATALAEFAHSECSSSSSPSPSSPVPAPPPAAPPPSLFYYYYYYYYYYY